MSNRKKIIRIGFVLIFLLVTYSSWYNIKYSMDFIESYEVNPQIQERSILIATQGSEYKNAIVKKIVEYFSSQSIYVKVADVSILENVDESVWSAILILHTWEMWKPPVEVETFLTNIKSKDKIVVLTTSGNGDYKMENVDAITGASLMKDIPSKVEEIKNQLNGILKL